MTLKTAQTILKVIGILTLIGAVIGIIGAIILIAGGGAIASNEAVSAELEASAGVGAGVVIALGVVGLIGSVIEIVEGIFALKAAKDSTKWKGCWILALISIILGVVGIIVGIATGNSGNLLNDIISIVLAGITFWAANTVKQNAGQ